MPYYHNQIFDWEEDLKIGILMMPFGNLVFVVYMLINVN